MKKAILLGCSLLLFCSCENIAISKKEKESVEKKEVLLNGLVSSGTKPGEIKREITYKDGIKNGPAREYFANGKLYREQYFENNRLHGTAIYYDRNGKKEKSIEYAEGVKHGDFITYFKSGNIKSKISYIKNLPQPGGFEMDYRGKEIKQPKIIVRRVDRLKDKNLYELHVSLSPSPKEAEFYAFPKDEADWNRRNRALYKLDEKSANEGQLEIYVPPNMMVAHEIHFYASFKSKMGNDIVITDKINLAVENIQL